MFPTFDLNEGDTIPVDKPMGKVFLFDFHERKHVMRDGKPVEATYEEAIKQWVSTLLITESQKYKVYRGTDFGMALNQFVGRRDIPIGVIASEAKRQLEEVLILHPEITGLDDFKIERADNKAEMSFVVITKSGAMVGIESEVKYSG